MDWFLSLPLFGKFGLTIGAASLFSLLLARQVGIGLEHGRRHSALNVRMFCWFMVAVSGTMIPIGIFFILNPSTSSVGPPGTEWLFLLIPTANFLAGIQLLLRNWGSA